MVAILLHVVDSLTFKHSIHADYLKVLLISREKFLNECVELFFVRVELVWIARLTGGLIWLTKS